MFSEAELLAAKQDTEKLFDRFFGDEVQQLTAGGELKPSETIWESVSHGIQSFRKKVSRGRGRGRGKKSADKGLKGEAQEIKRLSSEQIDELVFRLKDVGDRINKDLETKNIDLQDFITKNGSSLTYDDFSTHVNEVYSEMTFTERRSIDDLLLMLYLSGRVVQGLQTGVELAKDYFRQYMATEFREAVALQTRE